MAAAARSTAVRARTASCGEAFATARAYVFTPPRTGLYQLRLRTNVMNEETVGALSVLAGCAGPELACVARFAALQETQVSLTAGVSVLLVVRTSRVEDGGVASSCSSMARTPERAHGTGCPPRRSPRGFAEHC